MKKVLAAVFLVAFIPGFVSPAASEVAVELRLDRGEATTADSLRLVVSVSGTRKSDAPPRIEGLETFKVTKGGTSTQVNIVNGEMTSGIDYTYFIQPGKAGSYRIGPATVEVDGLTYRSAVANLEISSPASAEEGRGPLYLTSSLSAREVYAEEQVLYTLRLYRQVRVGDVSLDLPEATGLDFRQFGNPREYSGVHDGKSYDIFEIRYIVTPSREGTYTLAPARMGLTVYESRRRSRQGFFDDSFFAFSSGKPMTLASGPVQLKVLALPEEGRPSGFSGLVGSFTMQTSLEPPELAAGDSATVTIVFKGRGNVKRIPDLALPPLDGIKVYGDEPVFTMNQDGGGTTGEKTMKWALVPDRPGEYVIPSLSIPYFDTRRRSYGEAKSRPLTLAVRAGGSAPAQSLSPNVPAGERAPGKRAVEELGRDILPVHTSLGSVFAATGKAPQGVVFWLLILGPVGVWAAVLAGKHLARPSPRSEAAAKAKKAFGRFRKTVMPSQPTVDELMEAVREYLNARLGLSLGSLTASEAGDLLCSRGIHPDRAAELRERLRLLEDAAFTGRGGDAASGREDLVELLRKIERELV